MSTENLSGTPAPVDNSPSLVSVVGDLYGDYRDAEPDPDAGAPPPSSPETPAPGSEGTDPSAPAGETPAVADAAAVPDASTPDPDGDPLDGSAPLAYTVNGESRTNDGITVLKDGGAIIDPDAVPKIQRILSERDHLFEKDQQSHQRYTALEKLTEWRTTGADGKESVLTGAPAVEAMRVNAVTTAAVLQTVLKALSDPASFAELHDVVGDETAGYQIVRNERNWNALVRDARNDAREKAGEVRQHVSRLSAPTPPPEPSVADVAMPTVEATITNAQVTGLTAADKTFLASQLPRYVRESTPAERQATNSARVVDASFTDLVKDRAALRADAAKQVTGASDAAKANAAKLAAASVGKRGAPQAPKITPKKEPVATRDDDFDTAWDRLQSASAGAMRAHVAGPL